MLSNLAQVAELSVVQNAETASHYGKVQNAAWSHLVVRQGNMDAIRKRLQKLNRDRQRQGAQDGDAACDDRAQGSSSGSYQQRPPFRPSSKPNRRGS